MSKACAVCYKSFGEEYDFREVLDHYNRNHWTSELLTDVIADVVVEVECENCGKSFESGVTPSSGGFFAKAYCDECKSLTGFNALLSQPISSKTILENEVMESNHE